MARKKKSESDGMSSFPHQVWSTPVMLATGFRVASAGVVVTLACPLTVDIDGVEQLPPVKRQLEPVFHPGLLENMH